MLSMPQLGNLVIQGFFSVRQFGRFKELSSLRDHLRQAKKQLSSTTKDLRHEQEREIIRLEQAIKRAESLANVDHQRNVERAALRGIKEEEKQKGQSGRGRWGLKKAEQKRVVAQARYSDLAQEGGRHAVQKALAKKQRKLSQKEKKSRPFK